ASALMQNQVIPQANAVVEEARAATSHVPRIRGRVLGPERVLACTASIAGPAAVHTKMAYLCLQDPKALQYVMFCARSSSLSMIVRCCRIEQGSIYPSTLDVKPAPPRRMRGLAIDEQRIEVRA